MTDTLRVVANPYAHLDEKGRAAGSCPFEAPVDGSIPRKAWVGARLHPTKTRITETYPKGDMRRPLQETVFEFDAAPVTVPNTPYYRERIRQGDLFAADAATAAECGRKFADPSKSIDDAKARAVAEWKARELGFEPACLTEECWAAASPAAEPPPPMSKKAAKES